ncbi:MAG: site-specific DNA-methyltransferase [Chloroflexi bacterium]|nr:site-specific DNA-methyltransferase [Chloroflexota bacterium]
MDYQVICGDSDTELSTLAARSVDLVVTSPPYFQQREYGAEGLGNEETVEQYLESIMTTFAKVVRVMKPTGNIVYNMGDKIIDGSMLLVPYRFALNVLSDFNLRLVNDITWVKSNPTPHQFSRRLIASTEPFFHFALGSDYYYDRKAFQRAGRRRRSKPTKKLGSKYRDLIDSSTLSQTEKEGAHRALDEVIYDVRKGKIHSFRMKIRGIHAPAYGGQEGGRKMRIERYGFTIIRISGQPLKRDVIENPVESLPGNGHPAVFPVKVIRELIRLLCPESGTVLDPYLGSGSTMVAALLEGRSCIGIDISRDYCIDAQERMRHSLGETVVPVMERLS